MRGAGPDAGTAPAARPGAARPGDGVYAVPR